MATYETETGMLYSCRHSLNTMRNFYHFLKAAFLFARYQAWADAGLWQAVDAVTLTAFLSTATGVRLRQFLAATVCRQQALALNSRKAEDLIYEAGYSAGQKALASAITGLCDHTQFTEQGDTDADPATNQEAS